MARRMLRRDAAGPARPDAAAVDLCSCDADGVDATLAAAVEIAGPVHVDALDTVLAAPAVVAT